MADFYYTNEANDGDWATVTVPYTGSFEFSGQPDDGDTVALWGLTYEFDNDESTNGFAVAIGATLADTLNNLISRVLVDLEVSAFGDLVTLTAAAGAVNVSVLPGGEGGSLFSAASSVITANDLAGGSVGNWRLNAVDGPLATALPTSTDDAVVLANVASVAGGPPTVANLTVYATKLTIPITVTGMATFDNYAYNDYSGTVTGNATFNNYSYNVGTVTGNATFDNYSYNADSVGTGTVSGDATFDNYAWNNGYVIGNATFGTGSYNEPMGGIGLDATFNSDAYNDGYVSGNATFNDYSRLIGSTINGNATFNDYAYVGDGYGRITGNAEFNDNSYIHRHAPGNVYSSFFVNVVGGTATFRGNARNDGGIYGGTVLAYEKGINGSSILGVV